VKDAPSRAALAADDPVARIEAHRRLVLEVLTTTLAGARQVIVVDWPHYQNVGDSAIWLGQLAALRTIGVRVRATACVDSYDPVHLDQVLGEDGAVLLSGGGNFGDLWPKLQDFRERVVADFVHRPIIQLPQSVHFQDPRRAEATAARMAAHPRFAMMVRDQPSLTAARTMLGTEALLVPDMAMALGPLRREGTGVGLSWNSRTDLERPADDVGKPGIPSWDWVERPAQWESMLEERLRWRVTTPRTWWGRRVRLRRVLQQREALRRLRWGLALLTQGEVVVTNRLHGHILSLLLGLPQFLSDTRQGKLAAYHAQWTAGLPGVVLCASEAAALRDAAAALSGTMA